MLIRTKMPRSDQNQNQDFCSSTGTETNIAGLGSAQPSIFHEAVKRI